MFSVNYEKKDNIEIIRLCGDLTAVTVQSLKNKFENKHRKSTNYIFDLQNLEVIDSTGLGFIITCLKEAIDNKVQIKLLHLCNQPKIIFEITRVNTLFDVYENEDSALQSFSSKGQHYESTYSTVRQTV